MTKIILASFLAKAGVASRRASIKHIQAGDILVNDAVVREPQTYVEPGCDSIRYKKKLLQLPKHRYLLLHKPKGYICSAQDKHADKLIFDLIPKQKNERLFTVGRLDKDSEGLLLLTNDGDWSQKISHPRYQLSKTYRIDVIGKINQRDMEMLTAGIHDSGELLTAVRALIINRNQRGGTLEIMVREGKKRELRRMCSKLRYHVNRLMRIKIGPLRLGRFNPGFFRELTADEVKKLETV